MTNCPVCDYSLENAPEPYVCPQCKMEFDEYTHVVHTETRWFWTSETIVAYACILIGLSATVFGGAIFAGILCMFVAFFNIVIALVTTTDLRAVVSRGDGLILVGRKRRQIFYPWEFIDEIRILAPLGRVFRQMNVASGEVRIVSEKKPRNAKLQIRRGKGMPIGIVPLERLGGAKKACELLDAIAKTRKSAPDEIVRPNRRLEECPACGYSLTGLPDVYRCPECSMPFDPKCFAFVPRRKKPWFALAVWIVIAVVIMLITLCTNDMKVFTVTAVITACAVWGTCCPCRVKVVAVTREGVFVVCRNGDKEAVDWSEIEDVRVGDSAHHLQIVNSKQAEVLSLFSHHVAGPANLLAIAASVNRLKKTYAANSETGCEETR